MKSGSWIHPSRFAGKLQEFTPVANAIALWDMAITNKCEGGHEGLWELGTTRPQNPPRFRAFAKLLGKCGETISAGTKKHFAPFPHPFTLLPRTWSLREDGFGLATFQNCKCAKAGTLKTTVPLPTRRPCWAIEGSNGKVKEESCETKRTNTQRTMPRKSSPPKRAQKKAKSPRAFQRFHLVLDLDATCVSTISFDDPKGEAMYKQALESITEIEKVDAKKASELRKRIHLFSLGDQKMWTILRPFAFEFMEFAAYYFNRISVWSAGQEDYVNEIVSLLFPVYMPRPELVLSWSNCERTFVEYDGSGKVEKVEKTLSETSSNGNSDYHSFGKPLRHLNLYLKDKISTDLRHVMILDDRSDIAEDNINNLIQIPAYAPTSFTRNDLVYETDTAFSDLTKWLMRPEVKNASDVRRVGKKHIFKQTSSSTASPSSPSPVKKRGTKK